MITIGSIVTNEKDYLEGFQFVSSLKETIQKNAGVILDPSSDVDDFKPEFTRASLKPDVQEKVFPAQSISLMSDVITEDDNQFITCSMELKKDASRDGALLCLVDESGKTKNEIFLSNDDISHACKIQIDLDRDPMVAGGQRVTGDDIPLIKLIQANSDSTIIGNRDELQMLSKYIYHGVLGKNLEAFMQRGLDLAEKSPTLAPTLYYQ